MPHAFRSSHGLEVIYFGKHWLGWGMMRNWRGEEKTFDQCSKALSPFLQAVSCFKVSATLI